MSRQNSLPGTPTGRVRMSLDSGVVTGSPRAPLLGLRAGTWAMPLSGVAASRGETSGMKAVGRSLDATAVRWQRHQLSLQEEQVPAPIYQATCQHTSGKQTAGRKPIGSCNTSASERLHAQAKAPGRQCNMLCSMRCACARRAFVPNNHMHTQWLIAMQNDPQECSPHPSPHDAFQGPVDRHNIIAEVKD
ncbi:hypothetical protein NDU88_002722 [Pleurodeles waltl]|uniref:Uncharacterized protein n=1 Tax=Pleurodeles waltl TaxID=8319 RepID=A0AAV7T3C2_PLEWA|nr:hypothetical protein NDU88_002722 [Pleurodeles waltl]